MYDAHAEELGETRPVTIGTLPALTHLRERIIEEGFNFVALHELDKETSEPLHVLWDFGSFARIPRKLRHVARGRVIAWSLESPLVAHRAYHRLAAITARSRYVLGFPGTRELIQDASTFQPILYPNDSRSVANDPPWDQRKPLVMISSNKSVLPTRQAIDLAHPYRTARRLAAGLLASSYRIRGQWVAPDLYRERVKAIEHFAQRDGFTLFGNGWRTSAHQAGGNIARSYKGAVPDKHEALRHFRFALCFENTRFPGYITEKIFDCFYARTIPIYLGAPDVARYIPTEAFVDVEGFSSYDELEDFISDLSQEQANQYLGAAASFLSSEGAEQFGSHHFVERMMSALQHAAARD